MVREDLITSKENARVKNLRKLHKRKERRKSGMFLIDGEHLVEEAIDFDQKIHCIIVSDSYTPPFSIDDFEVIHVTEAVMKTLSLLETPQGIMAAVSYRAPRTLGDKVLVLDDVQDPGNVGSLLRTADAFGFSRVVVSPETVDPFSDKVLRSAQGSTFHINIEVAEIHSHIENFNGLTIGTSLKEAAYLEDIDLEADILVVLGNEGRGVSDAALELVDQTVKIQMSGASESLNVAIAGGILMHHFKS